ncbi:MAG: hypothetical protein Kow0032_24050 [Methyloligellaceae bacterium]
MASACSGNYWIRFQATFFIALCISMLVLGPRNSALAGPLQCIDLFNPERAARASEILAETASCAALGVSDPARAIVTTAIFAAGIGGAFSGKDECEDKINGIVGRMLAEALLSSPVTKDLVKGFKEDLKKFIEGNQTVSLRNILQQLGSAGELLNSYISCGCAIAGAPADLDAIRKEIEQAGASCVNFGEEAVEWVANSVQHENMAPNNCPEYGRIATGQWTDIPPYPSSHRPPCGPATVCNPGDVVQSRLGSSGRYEYRCAKSCPEPVAEYKPGARCHGRMSYKVVEGRCKAVAEEECCPDGQAVSESGPWCGPACRPGIEIYDRKTRTCSPCNAGFHPIYEESGNSIGSCQQCPYGATYNLAALKCECPPGQHVREATGVFPSAGGKRAGKVTDIRPVRPDGRTPGGLQMVPGGVVFGFKYCGAETSCGANEVLDKEGRCRTCPSGTVPKEYCTYETGKSIQCRTACDTVTTCGRNEVRGKNGKCTRCGEGRVAYRGKCILTTRMPEELTLTIPPVPVKCLPGQIRKGAQCVWPPCPRGQIRKGAACVFPPCPRGQVRKGAACVFPPCPRGQIRKGAQCVFPPCPRGQIRKGAACVFPPCPRGQIRKGAACVFPPCPRGQIRIGPACVFPPCPRGQIRKGAACVFPPCPRGQIRIGPACVWPPCPPNHVRRGSSCVPVVKRPPIAPSPQFRVLPRPGACPPGTRPVPGGCAPGIR